LELDLNTGVVIERGEALPQDLDLEMLSSARREDFVPLKWLKEEWLNRTNQFSGLGEGLFTARDCGRLVAICGLNRDPYDESGSAGRLRRLYVLPDYRRRGVGRMLVEAVLEASRDHFDAVNLRTLDEASAAFFESLGFSRVDGVRGATHRLTNA
jgi:GNAT superfamily N-acetyltransferase